MITTKAHAVLSVVIALASAAEASKDKAVGNSEERCTVNARFLFLIDTSGSTIRHKEQYFKFVDKAIDYLHGVSEDSAEAGDVDVAIAAFGICLVPRNDLTRREWNAECSKVNNTIDYMIQRPFGGNWQTLKEEKTTFKNELYERYANGYTPTDAALSLAREMFKNETSGKVEAQNMVAMVLTDGAPSHYNHSRGKYEGFEFSSSKMKAAADRLKNDGFKLFTIYIENSEELGVTTNMSRELMQYSSSPNMSFTVSDFSDNQAFDNAFSAIAKDVCSRASVAPHVIPDEPVGTVAPIESEPTMQSDHIAKDQGGTGIMIGVISAAFLAAALAAAIAVGFMMRNRRLKVGQASMVPETRDRETTADMGRE